MHQHPVAACRAPGTEQLEVTIGPSLRTGAGIGDRAHCDVTYQLFGFIREGEGMRIEGRVAMVSGGSSGLGAATASALAARGATVVALDLQEPRDAVKGVTFVRADVTDAAAVEHAVAVATELGPLGILINCAGVGSNERTARRRSDGTGVPADLGAFRRVIDINLVGTFNCMRLAAAAMSAADPDEEVTGVIVNTSSIAAYEGQVGQAAYAASKAAVVALTFTAARDLAPMGIRVNAIAPGMIETPILGGIRDDIKAGLVESVVWPRRIGRPEEYAGLAVHLIENDYINGETVRLDAATRLPYR